MKILILLLIAAVFSDCTPRPKPTVSSDQGMPVAQIDQQLITDHDLLERIRTIESKYPRVYSTHNQKKELLQELIHVELLYQEALRRNLDQRYEFKSRLADFYVEELSRNARQQITQKDIEDFYRRNRFRYEQISARHILIKEKSENEMEEARQKLNEIRNELLQSPELFPRMARQYSEDTTNKESGGDLGFFVREAMVEPFSDAAFKLKNVGEISPVVQTKYGLHLIQLTGDRRDIKFYMDQVRDHLTRQTQRARLDAELTRLKHAHSISVFEDNLLKLSPLPEGVLKDPEDIIPKGELKDTFEGGP